VALQQKHVGTAIAAADAKLPRSLFGSDYLEKMKITYIQKTKWQYFTRIQVQKRVVFIANRKKMEVDDLARQDSIHIILKVYFCYDLETSKKYCSSIKYSDQQRP
jgi:hypothetical protein